VARKAQLKRTKDRQRPRENPRSHFRSTSTYRSSGLTVQQPTPPIREQATCFAQQSYLDNWLWPSVLDLTMADNAAVSSSITALGLAVLANTRISPTLMIAAREEYTGALASTNRTLRDLLLSKSGSP
jgi:hypothetical protein